jgi:type IV secretion system protein VirB5
LNQAVERFNELRKLVVKVNQAPDAKDILDLQGRIQAEETLLQNEMLKLQMMQSQAQAEQAVLKQQQTEKLLDIKGNPDDYRI